MRQRKNSSSVTVSDNSSDASCLSCGLTSRSNDSGWQFWSVVLAKNLLKKVGHDEVEKLLARLVSKGTGRLVVEESLALASRWELRGEESSLSPLRKKGIRGTGASVRSTSSSLKEALARRGSSADRCRSRWTPLSTAVAAVLPQKMDTRSKAMRDSGRSRTDSRIDEAEEMKLEMKVVDEKWKQLDGWSWRELGQAMFGNMGASGWCDRSPVCIPLWLWPSYQESFIFAAGCCCTELLTSPGSDSLCFCFPFPLAWTYTRG